MDIVELKADDMIPSAAGAGIMFHLIRWDNEMNSFTLKAGGNILYHTLSEGTTLHTHDFAEIFLVLKGRLVHCINGELIPLGTGDLCFIRPGDRHHFEQSAKDSAEIVNFAFHLELLADFGRYLGCDRLLRTFTAPSLPPTIRIRTDDAEKIGSELLTINSMQITNIEDSALRARCMLARLFSMMLSAEGILPQKNKAPEWLEFACAQMKRGGNLVDGVKELRKLTGRSPESLCAAFQRYYAKTPTDFINQLRLESAARLLVDDDAKLSNVAGHLGFESLSHFHKLFRCRYGVTPAKFRKLARRSDIPTN